MRKKELKYQKQNGFSDSVNQSCKRILHSIEKEISKLKQEVFQEIKG